MSNHVLLKNAFKFNLEKVNTNMTGFFYEEASGYWISEDTEVPYIMDTRSIKPSSKKYDVETGEDQKGE